MTIKLLTPRGVYPVNAILTLDAATEAALVADKVATINLTGGFVWTPPVSNPDPKPLLATDAQAAAFQSLVSGAGNSLNLWSPEIALQTASQLTKEIRAAHLAVNTDWTPTHFCDPSAIVDGSGTLASPYQVSQLAAIFTGRKKSVVLGMKRGGVYRGSVSLNVGGDGLDGAYFSIVPYGSNSRLPMFISSQNVTTWASAGGGAYAIVMTGFANQNAAERDVFQNNARLLRLTSLAAVQASAGGTQFNVYSAGTLTIYIKPFDGEDPNLGQIEVGGGDNGFVISAYADGTRTGGIQIHGIHVSGTRNSAISINTGGIAASGLVINQCVAGNTGEDYANSLGMDGIIINGGTNAARAKNVAVLNNYLYNVRNNAVEMSFIDGAVVEGNKSRNVGGASLIECWDAVSNIKVRFNSGIGDPDNTFRQTVGQFANCGFWSAGQTDGDALDAGGTANVNNEFSLNYIQDSSRAWKFISGTGHKVHHNTYYIKNTYGKAGANNYEGGVTTGSNTLAVNHSNNLYLANNQLADGCQMMNLSVAAAVTGNNNYYMAPLGSMSMRVAGSTKFTLEDWVTAMGGSVDTNSKVGPGFTATPATWAVDYNKVMVDHTGRPVGNSALRGKGIASLNYTENGVTLQYTRDLEGKPMLLTAPTVGCYA